MNLEQLRQIAAADAADKTDARRMMAGAYGLKAAAAIETRDWPGATDYLIKAASRRPQYVAALRIIDMARAGATRSEAKSAASRSNGKKGGRPRKRETPNG